MRNRSCHLPYARGHLSGPRCLVLTAVNRNLEGRAQVTFQKELCPKQGQGGTTPQRAHVFEGEGENGGAGEGHDPCEKDLLTIPKGLKALGEWGPGWWRDIGTSIIARHRKKGPRKGPSLDTRVQCGGSRYRRPGTAPRRGLGGLGGAGEPLTPKPPCDTANMGAVWGAPTAELGPFCEFGSRPREPRLPPKTARNG